MKHEGLFLAQNQYSESISYFITILLTNEEQLSISRKLITDTNPFSRKVWFLFVHSLRIMSFSSTPRQFGIEIKCWSQSQNLHI